MTVSDKRSPHPIARVMSLRDFRLLLADSTTALLGDQFALIATPWQVLRSTVNPLALGMVLALAGLPRAVFRKLGGAVLEAVFLFAGAVGMLMALWSSLQSGWGVSRGPASGARATVSELHPSSKGQA